jgi:hypothetical protein
MLTVAVEEPVKNEMKLFSIQKLMMIAKYCSLPIAHCSLLIAYCQLPIAHCSLPLIISSVQGNF